MKVQVSARRGTRRAGANSYIACDFARVTRAEHSRTRRAFLSTASRDDYTAGALCAATNGGSGANAHSSGCALVAGAAENVNVASSKVLTSHGTSVQ